MRRWSIRLVLFLVGSASLLAIGLATRLARGPIDLGFLRPTLEQSLSASDGSFRVALATVALAWNDRERQTEILVTGVRIVGQDGRTVLQIPAVDVGLKRGALLRGRILPVDVRLRDARLTIVRDADGTLDLGVSGAARTPGEGVDLRSFVDGLARRAATEAPLRLSAHGAEIAIVDQGPSESWRLTGVDLVLEPDAQGADAELAGQLEVATHRVPIRGTARYRVGRDRGTVSLGFRRLLPEIVSDLPLWNADQGPPDWATALRVPLDGALVLTLDSALRPRLVHGRLRGAAGTVHLPGDTLPQIDVTNLRLRGRVDVAGRRLDVQTLALDLGATRLHAAGGLTWTADGAIAVDATTAAERFPLELLDRWWPAAAAPEVRRWVVERRRGGVFTTAELALHMGAEAASRRLSLEIRRGRADFAGVGVAYDDRLPPVTDANGSVWLDHRGWTLRADRGRVGAIALAGATALFPVDDARRARPRLTAALRGPLRDALAIVDREPFGYARALGITPDAMKGFVTARLTIAPAPAGSPDAAVVSGDAHLVQVATDAVLNGAPVRDGDVALSFEPGRLRATGTARIASAPISFTWSQETGSAQRQTRRATVSGRLDAETRRVLGFDLAPWVEGPMEAEARVDTSQASGTLELTLLLDDTRIEPGIARLAKPAGAPGRASARFTLRNNVVTRADQIFVQAGPTTVTGSASRPNGWDDIRLQADIAGHSPDTRPAGCALAIDQQRGGHGFRLTSDDAGALLSAIGGGEGLRGGTLVVAGTATPSGARTDATATLDIQNPVFTDRSVLRRVIALGSLSSLESAFTGSGMRFERIGAALRWQQPTLTVTDGIAQGSALTVAIDGTIEQPSGTLDLRGTVIPSYYGLNTAPGRIPVVGNLIGSGRDKAIQAIDFTAIGPIQAPSVQVKALSAIAPGALREVLRKLHR